MMDHTQRLTNVVKGALKEAALANGIGERYGYNVAQGLVVVPTATDKDGNVISTDVVLGWTITVTMGNPLIGYPDIALAYPLPQILPPDKAFGEIAKQLLIAVQQQHDEAGKMPAPAERMPV